MSSLDEAEVHSTWHVASRATILLTLLAAPFAFGAVLTWAWAALCILCWIALASWAIGSALAGRIRIFWSPLHSIGLSALLLVLLQLLSGRTLDPIGTRESLIKLAGYCTIFFLASQLSVGVSVRTWRVLGFTLTAYVFAMAVFAIIQYFSNAELIYWTIKPRWGGSIFGPYVNHNHYAGLFEVLLPLAIGAVLASPQRHFLKLLGSFAVLLGLVSVLLCSSRGGTIALVVELGLLLLIVSFAGSEARKMAVLVALAGTVLAAVLFVWLDPGRVLNRWEATARAPEMAAGARIDIAADSVQMFGRHPVLGVGSGTYEVAYPPYQSWTTDRVVDHAHNDYLELLAETGVAGGFLLVVFLGVFFRQAFLGIRERSVRPEDWMRTCAVIACCGLLVHSFTDFNLHIPANAAWFCAALGLAVFPSKVNAQFAEDDLVPGRRR